MNPIVAHLFRIFVCLVGLLAGVRLLGALDWLPPRVPPSNVEDLVVSFQQQASHKPDNANILFLGDSSCLMGVSIPQIETATQGTFRGINLGTMSYLPLSSFAGLGSNYMTINPRKINAVILLIHPEMASSENAPRVEIAEDAQNLSPPQLETPGLKIKTLLGFDLLQNHLIRHVVPGPLKGSYGVRYGFDKDLIGFMRDESGGLLDPRPDFRHSTQPSQWKPNQSFLAQARTFKASLPEQIKLFFSLTPIPQAAGGADQSKELISLRTEVSEALGAAPLDLPLIYPRHHFVSSTHLNEVGRRRYTRTVANLLTDSLVAAPAER